VDVQVHVAVGLIDWKVRVWAVAQSVLPYDLLLVDTELMVLLRIRVEVVLTVDFDA
jgi:hypothetical protein